MTVVIMTKEPFVTTTLEYVVSISYNTTTKIVTVNNGTDHTYFLDAIKLMIL